MEMLISEGLSETKASRTSPCFPWRLLIEYSGISMLHIVLTLNSHYSFVYGKQCYHITHGLYTGTFPQCAGPPLEETSSEKKDSYQAVLTCFQNSRKLGRCRLLNHLRQAGALLRKELQELSLTQTAVSDVISRLQ